jgi:hypothetical protein
MFRRSRIASLAFVAAALATLVSSAHAQSADSAVVKSPRRSAWTSTMRLGAGSVALDLDGVRPVLAQRGFTGPGGRIASIGPQLTWQRHALVIALTGQQLVTNVQDHERMQLRTSGGYGMLDVGLAIAPRSWLSVRPVVGLGVSSVRLELTSRDVVGVDSLLQAPTTETTITGRSYLRHVGLDVVVDVPVSRRGRHVSLELDAGSVAPLDATRWRRTYVAANGTPRASLSGSYVRVAAGTTGGSAKDALLPLLLTLATFVR